MIRKASKHIVCGISGGVDSAVAAMLLKKKGHRVTGVFMRNWDGRDEFGVCSVDKDLEDAEYVCKKLDIPLHEVNFVKEYWNDVFSYMIRSYENGYTPNPDILCNKHIKFNAFLDYSVNRLGADYVATGHYAKTSSGEDPHRFDTSQGVKLLKAQDHWKDQTFFLSQISQMALQKAVFPIGDFHKNIVKEIAKRIGLERIAAKKESMGMCFIGSRDFKTFIEQYIQPKTGNFINLETGNKIGTHKGTHYFTLGQRANISGLKHAMFIAEMDHKTQNIFVVPGTNHPALFTQTLFTKPAHWIHLPPRDLLQNQMFDCDFRFQHVHPLVKCTLTLSGSNCLIVSFSQLMRAVTPGQFAVFYKDEECLGSAEIVRTGPSSYVMNGSKPIENPNEFS
ncbi:mitochondrial tRNA-specific 2-thiouridylase 1-like [Tubulanus polymorphus]|uniref:mitochondrial tRNA-specific 2-thiouridylase 1-like n=1 Tax=Tubulanus polymorphus TaxID=672921 RepID=UPI003DA29EB0